MYSSNLKNSYFRARGMVTTPNSHFSTNVRNDQQVQNNQSEERIDKGPNKISKSLFASHQSEAEILYEESAKFNQEDRGTGDTNMRITEVDRSELFDTNDRDE
jgi:hypothetical protein